MAYMFKQKLSLEELVNLPKAGRRVLVYEPNEYLGALYRHYLRAHNFDVRHCPDLALLKQALAVFGPNLLVFSADDLRPERAIKDFSAEFPGLKIITTAYNLNHEAVGELLAAGVLSHINRRFSRPQDLVVLAGSLINY